MKYLGINFDDNNFYRSTGFALVTRLKYTHVARKKSSEENLTT